jgi:putative protease
MPSPKKPEVMSPAGHWPQLHAAIEAGADACYFGLKHFSARAKVGFELSELPEAMRTLHRRGVRGYLTFNTLVFEHELAEAARVIGCIAEAGVDAIIVQDIGVLKMARQIAPDLELHASTQTSISSAQGVEFALAQGADRVTLARELSLEEVAAIYEKTKADLEIFVHGALCVAYSVRSMGRTQRQSWPVRASLPVAVRNVGGWRSEAACRRAVSALARRFVGVAARAADHCSRRKLHEN